MYNLQFTIKKLRNFIHSTFSIIHSPRAFTIIELLVVIGVIGIMGIILSETFFRSVRGSTRAQILAKIKQNGQAVMEKMDKNIRGADGVITICNWDSDSSADTIILKQSGVEGAFIRYRFEKELPGPPRTNGRIVVDYPTITTDDLNNPDPLILEGICTFTPSLPEVLTDTNPVTGVSVVQPTDSGQNFIVIDPPLGSTSTARTTVTVSLGLQAGVNAPAAIQAQISPVYFKTTVEPRI